MKKVDKFELPIIMKIKREFAFLLKGKNPEEAAKQLAINSYTNKMLNDALELDQKYPDIDALDTAYNYIKTLRMGMLLSPLTGDDDEWKEVHKSLYDTKYVLEQNTRCPSVFRRDHDNLQAYNIDVREFTHDYGRSWYISQDEETCCGLSSKEKITFPYTVPELEAVYLTEDKTIMIGKMKWSLRDDELMKEAGEHMQK